MENTPKEMTLKKWIEIVGAAEVARLIKVSEMTVSHWKNFKVMVRPKHMVKIVKVTNGAVSYKSMVESFARVEKILKDSGA